MKCPDCGTDNSEDAQFCGNCGASTSVSEAKGNHRMVDRMIRACRLDVHLFEEVEADKSATRQAFSVVVLVALATGIASLGTSGLSGLFAGAAIAIAGWAIWAWLLSEFSRIFSSFPSSLLYPRTVFCDRLIAEVALSK